MSGSNYLLAAKELFKYKNPSVVRLVQEARQAMDRKPTAGSDELVPLWSVFLIYKCTTDCPYAYKIIPSKTIERIAH